MGLRSVIAANQGITDVLLQMGVGGHHLVQGVSGSQRALLADALIAKSQAPVLFITNTLKEATTLLGDYQFFSNKSGYLFPPRPTLAAEVDAESHELESRRIVALQKVVTGEPCFIVAPATALFELLPPPDFVKGNSFDVTPGEIIPLERLVLRLSRTGYQRVERVDGRGQFSQRGDIVDIYPPAGGPYRVEFFDEKVESIRGFDPASQRSQKVLSKVSVGPARLLPLSEELTKRVLARFNDIAKSLSPLFLPQLDQDREFFANRIAWPGAHNYLEYLFERPSCLLEYFRAGSVMIAETGRVFEHLELEANELSERHQRLLEKGKLLPGIQPWLSVGAIVGKWTQPTMHLALLASSVKAFRLKGSWSLPFYQAPSFYGQQELVIEEIAAWHKRGSLIVIVGASGQLSRVLTASDIPVREGAVDDLEPGSVNFVSGQLSAGLLLAESLVILSANELNARKRTVRRPRPQEGMSAGELEALTPGEYVVHFSHGIGQYLGVVVREAAGAKRDYLCIKYAGKDRLYLPTDQVHLLQRYLGGGDKPPKLYPLGGGDWQRVKAKVRDSVQKMALDLLELYAARQEAPGHAFAKDSPWQRELEDGFAFQETKDQFTAIAEVKKDMEQPRPMDRLLCGDVGYGKTEVALRAAMKAVLDAKQVVVLAPTTILAQQHFHTFRERFSQFPIRVEVLSRLKTAAQQREIIAAASAGAVDILLGTHRLLQKDVKLPNLGLLVVDEEQRFGVEHKERIKQIKTNVDILTMTATPIPRTLHMALLGIRDLSVINTPPEGRFPVQTYVMEYSDEIVVSAVRRELGRGGQVYVIFNRVQGIDSQASRLRKLLKGVNIGVVHGQMAETLLEQTMLDFNEGSYQVLLSTTIIENGLDIPNVNTVIVYDADRLGLSQLYQLRGRVGRGRKLAYAYFTYRRDKVLTEKSQKRLNAIKEFTELGAGFKLSIRDMEIRGTGNILGPEQHGYIAAVGFDLYCQLLEQQVSLLAGRPAVTNVEKDVVIELPIDAYIPEGYLPEQEKIYVYRRIKSAESPTAIDDIQEELNDRFGTAPPPLLVLLDVGRVRTMAVGVGIATIAWKANPLSGGGEVRLEYLAGQGPPPEKLQQLWLTSKRKYQFARKGKYLNVLMSTNKQDLLADLTALLKQLK